MIKVALGEVHKQYLAIKDEIDEAIHRVVQSGQFILGAEVTALEEELAEACGAKFAVAVNSGTDALLLALVAQGVGPGDEVITSPFTFVATAEAIALSGATPVFADIDPRSYNLDPDATRRALTPRTRAIMPVDLYGQMADRDAFLDIAATHGLQVIWDAAQAVGAEYADRRLGEYAGSSTLSFYPTKNLGAYGDGGMVLTNDQDVREKLLQYRFHGSGGGYYYNRIGYCSRLDALQAAVLRVKLRYLGRWNEERRRHANLYNSLLSNSPVGLPYCAPRAHHTYHQFTIRHTKRDSLRAHLKESGIESGVYYPLSLHLQRAYQYLGCKIGQFPEAERASREVLSIPVYPELAVEQIRYVAEHICNFDN